MQFVFPSGTIRPGRDMKTKKVRNSFELEKSEYKERSLLHEGGRRTTVLLVMNGL